MSSKKQHIWTVIDGERRWVEIGCWYRFAL